MAYHRDGDYDLGLQANNRRFSCCCSEISMVVLAPLSSLTFVGRRAHVILEVRSRYLQNWPIIFVLGLLVKLERRDCGVAPGCFVV